MLLGEVDGAVVACCHDRGTGEGFCCGSEGGGEGDVAGWLGWRFRFCF